MHLHHGSPFVIATCSYAFWKSYGCFVRIWPSFLSCSSSPPPPSWLQTHVHMYSVHLRASHESTWKTGGWSSRTTNNAPRQGFIVPRDLNLDNLTCTINKVLALSYICTYRGYVCMCADYSRRTENTRDKSAVLCRDENCNKVSRPSAVSACSICIL